MTQQTQPKRMTSVEAYRAVDVLIDRMGVELNTYERQKLRQTVYEAFTYDLQNGYARLAKVVLND